jgi:hypothetical protein
MAIDNLKTLNEWIRWLEVSLQQLAVNLHEIGYEFANQGGPLEKAQPNDPAIAMVEARYGELPTAFRPAGNRGHSGKNPDS